MPEVAPPESRLPPPPSSLPERWTPEHVGDRLVEAMRTLDRLPRVKGPRHAGNNWPSHRVEWADRLAQAELPQAERLEREALRNAIVRPSGAEIDAMDRALDWLRDLRDHDAGMALVTSLWALRTARRRSVRALCREKGWAPATLYKLRARALDHLAASLEARGTPVW